MTAEPTPRAGLRAQAACYAAGYFSLSLVSMGTLAVPLWALHIGASPFWIGIAIGARAFLPLLLAIHGGTLMDRIGAARVLMGLGIASMAVAPLHPVLPTVAALIALQLIGGLAQNTSWNAAQTLVARLGRGNPTLTGRFTFFTTLGSFSGPLISGWMWQHFGPWGAFGTMTIWSGGLIAAALLSPRESSASTASFQPRDLLPRLEDYVQAFKLALVSAVTVVVIGTFLRNIVFGIRFSFYPVYLNTTTLEPTEIGLLMGLGSLIAGPTGLLLARLMRRASADMLMHVSQLMMTAGLALTPLFVTLEPLVLLSLLFGIGTGINLPTLISSMSRAVDPATQGLGVALRATVNLASSMTTPIVMGIIAQWFGLEISFYAIGIGTLILMALSLPVIRKARQAEARQAGSEQAGSG